jgi:hypothetical protein
MTLEATPNLNKTADAGRDSSGRFRSGNRGGPGNPNAGKIAQFRQVVLECVTAEEMRTIARKLYEMALEGHWQSMKLFLLYTCGKPDAMPNEMVDAYLGTDDPVAAAPPSANGLFQEAPSPNRVNSEAPPSANGVFSEVAPSANGDSLPPLNRQERRALKKMRRLEKQKRNTPKPVAPPSPNGVNS